MKIQNQKRGYRYLTFLIILVVLIPMLIRIIRCSLNLSDLFTGMSVIATLFAAFIINNLAFDNLEKEFLIESSNLIEEKKIFWRVLRKKFSSQDPRFNLNFWILSGGMPTGLLSHNGKKIIVNNMNEYKIDDAINSMEEGQKKESQKKIREFTKKIYSVENNEMGELEESGNILLAYYIKLCNKNTYRFIRKNFIEDLPLMIILVWISFIIIQQNQIKVYQEKNFYLYTQKLIAQFNDNVKKLQ